MSNLTNHNRKLLIFIGIMTSILLYALDNMIVNPALAIIAKEFNSMSYLSYIIIAYLLTQTIITPIYGKLSDIYSRRNMMLLAVIWFIASSVLCALANDIYTLIGARALQGLGGGAIFVCAISLVGEIFSIEERAKYQAYISMMFAIASILGPTVGGYIVEHLSWRYVFLVNLPVGLISFALLYYLIPRDLHQSNNKDIDYKGISYLTIFLTAFVILFSFIDSNTINNIYKLLLTITIITFGYYFIKQEKVAANPVINLQLFRESHFVIPVALSALSGAILFSLSIYLQLFMQSIMHVTVSNSGLINSVMVISLMISSLFTARCIGKHKRYQILIMTGNFFLYLGLFFYYYTMNNFITIAPLYAYILFLIPIGVGLGTMTSSINIILQLYYERYRLGEITGASTLIRNLGGVIGTTIFAFVFNLGDHNTISQLLLNIINVFLLAMFIAFVMFNTSEKLKDYRSNSH